jgi:RNA polymerase sigma-70 factor (ECF subfamily)
MDASIDFARRLQICTDRLAKTGVAALGALFDLAANRLVRFAVAITRNQHDAEDAVQAVLVRMAGRPALLADVARPWPYLLQMVRNESLGIARRKQRLTSAGDLADLATHVPVDELEHEDVHRAVWSASRALPTLQAEVVVLKIWEGMTFAEIGEVLGASANTAASRYQYAIAKLSQRLSRVDQEVHRG